MRRLSLKPPAVVGLAISPQNIHLVQLAKCKQAYVLERLEWIALPAPVFAGGKIADFDMLRCTLESLGVRVKSATQWMVCVTANQVKMARMMMPAGLSDADIESEITTQMGRALPEKREVYRLDFHRQPVMNTLDTSVFYVATRNDYAARYELCLRSAGVALAAMEVDVLALLRAVRHALKFTLAIDEKTAVLYLGREYAVMVAVHGDDIIFHQQWNGGQDSKQAMTLMQWVEWCAQAYRQAGIGSLAIGGVPDEVYQASHIMNKHWPCKIYEIDPFARIAEVNNFATYFSQHARSTFLLAAGLAMREPLPWLK